MNERIINRETLSFGEYMRRIRSYRSLIIALLVRDIKAKYAQTTLGILWAVIQPLIALVIFSVFFDGLIQLETGEIAYPVFAFSGMIVWYYFSSIVHHSGNAVIGHQDLIKKIYFPRLILPLYKSLLGLFEFFISFLVFIVLMMIWQTEVKWTIVFIPFIVLLVTLVGLTIAIWLNVLTIRKRDFMHLIPYLVNYGIWLTPVFYPSTIIPEPYTDWIYYLNPVATCIELFRAAAFGTAFEWMHLLSFIVVFILFVIASYVFKKTERNIADYV